MLFITVAGIIVVFVINSDVCRYRVI